MATTISEKKEQKKNNPTWASFLKKGWPVQVIVGAYSKDSAKIRKTLDDIYERGNYEVRWRGDHLELIAQERLTQQQEDTLKKHYSDKATIAPDEGERPT